MAKKGQKFQRYTDEEKENIYVCVKFDKYLYYTI